jgi:hypothetical protein
VIVGEFAAVDVTVIVMVSLSVSWLAGRVIVFG